MPRITVHYGPPGSGRNLKLFEDCLKGYESFHTSFLYVVVAAQRRDQLKKTFLDRFSQVFEVPVVTFPELVRKLAKGETIDQRIIGEVEKRQLLGSVLGERSFSAARSSNRRVALFPFLSQYVSFVKRQNIRDGEMLRLHYRKFRKELGPIEQELVAIFSLYQHLLEECGCEDQDGLYCLLYEALLTGALKPVRAFPGLQRLVLEGFSSLMPVERGILQILASEIDETHFSLDLDSRERQPDHFSEACQELVDFLDRLEAEWVFHDRENGQVPVSFVRPETLEGEVLEVARRIAQLRDKRPQLDLAEVALICCRPVNYIAYLREILPDFGIPFRWLPGRSLAESKAVGTILQYIRVLDHDFPREELFDFLSSPWTRVPGLSRDETKLMERLSTRAGIVGGFHNWTIDFRSWIAQYTEELRNQGGSQESQKKQADRIDRVSSLFLKSLQTLRLVSEQSQSHRSCLEWAELLRKRLQPFFGDLHQPGDRALRWSRSENLSLARFLEELRNCASLGITRPLTFQGFAALLARELSHTDIHVDTEEPAVVVGDKWDFRQCRFRVLFWMGFAEGKFPDYPAPSVFLDHAVSGDWGLPNWKSNMAENYHLFHTLRHAASEWVYYSCPRRVAENPVLPSPFLRYLEPQSGLELPVSKAEQNLSGGHERWENIERGIRVQDMRDSSHLSAFDGVFSSVQVISLLRKKFFPEAVMVSPSQLENYAQCGFRYFLQRLLRVEPPLEIGEEWTPLERGSFIHRVLFRFMEEGFTPPSRKEAEPESRQKWTQTQRHRMAEIVREELSSFPFQDLFWKHQIKRLVDGLENNNWGLLARFIELEEERSGKFALHALESKFGPLPLDPLPILLQGTIDRIDRDADKYFLLDYKTGIQDYRKRVFEGWGFQLPLYIAAAREILGNKIQSAGFYYLRFPLEVKVQELAVRDQATFDRLVAYYRDKAVRLATQLYQGHFPVTLLGKSNAGCRACGYRDICRIDPVRMEEVKSSGRFLADETIVEKGRWVRVEEGEEGKV